MTPARTTKAQSGPLAQLHNQLGQVHLIFPSSLVIDLVSLLHSMLFHSLELLQHTQHLGAYDGRFMQMI